MKAPLYNEILEICQQIANASTEGNDEARTNACKDLQKNCVLQTKIHPKIIRCNGKL